jgi:hypothetical protein
MEVLEVKAEVVVIKVLKVLLEVVLALELKGSKVSKV